MFALAIALTLLFCPLPDLPDDVFAPAKPEAVEGYLAPPREPSLFVPRTLLCLTGEAKYARLTFRNSGDGTGVKPGHTQGVSP